MIKLLLVAVTLVSFVLYRAEKIHPAGSEKDISISSGEKNVVLKDSTILTIGSKMKTSFIYQGSIKPGAPYSSWNSLPSIIY